MAGATFSIVLQRHGREVVSTDLIDRGCGQGGVDFLLQRTAPARAIVTNPPFNRAEAFLRHAAKLGVEYVAFLHKAHWLNAAERGSMVESVLCTAWCYLLQYCALRAGTGAHVAKACGGS